MLGKLIKYDFKAIAKQMFPIYLVVLASTLITSIDFRLNIDQGLFASLITMTFMISLMASMFGTIYCVVSRFRSSLLKNEGYLYFALPVKTSTHIIAKIINAFIWSLIEGLLVVMCSGIGFLVLGDLSDIRELFSIIGQIFSIDDWSMVLMMLRGILLMMETLLELTCMIYAALAVGHLAGRHANLATAGFVILCFTLRTSIGFYNNDLYLYGMPLLVSFLYGALTWFILDRRLNLE